ncbi:MAG: hypothetical protein CL608_02695 [Anaerolineaceae bacterium]|nr:hypothetical protein [Anaerolineaceae bacterium]
MKLLRQADLPDHAVVRDQYEAHRDGVLTAAETAAYETHLRTCAACRQWLARQDALITDLRADMPPPYRLATDGAVQIQQAMYKQIKRSIFMQNVKLSLRTMAAVAAVVLIAAVALWWQYGRGEQTSTSPTETAVPNATLPASTAAEPTSLTFAAPPSQRSRYELVAALYNGLNPDVTVQVISLSPDSDPATQADAAVLQGNPAGAANYVNLADRLRTSTDLNPQDFFAGALQGCQAGDYAYGLPISFMPSFLYFDQTVLAEAGVTVPAAEWTWPELVQMITALSSGDGNRYGFGDVDGLLRLLRPLIANSLAETGTIAPADLQPHLQDVANLLAAGHVADVNPAELELLIANGRVGLWLDNPAALEARQLGLGDSLGRLPVPPLGDLAMTNPAEPACLAISRGSDQPEAAWRWLQYLVYNPPELPAGSVPANRLISNSFNENNAPTDSATLVAISRAWFSSRRGQAEALLPALRQHVVAGVPLEDALAQVASADPVEGSAEAEATVPVIASPPPDTGPTIIRFYGDQFRLAEAANAFRQTHPDIIVDISFNARVGAGGVFTLEDVAEQFDCFSWFGIGLTPTNVAGAVLDLSELVSPETLADYAPETLAVLQSDGALLGLPLEVNPIVVRYNENRFNERGVPLPTADWTLNELLNTAAQLGQTADPPVYGFISSAFDVLSGPEVVEMLLLEQGMRPWDVAAGTVNLTDPVVTAVVSQYVTWIQQNALYATLPGANFDERSSLIQNGRAALWTTRSDDRPIALGVPEPFAVLPLPQLNSNILSAPWQTVLFVSNRVEDPTACTQWIEYLTTRTDAITAVPARQSVLNSRSWQNEVGPENAAVFREALARHLAASEPDAELVSFGEKFPLYRWLQEAAAAAAAGGDLNALLAQAQAHSEQYLACLSGLTDPTFEEAEACAQQADLDYNSDNQ